MTGEVRPAMGRPKRWYAFQTDILIEKIDPVIPLVAIELKYGGFSTHDIITYSSKAVRHKQIYPYLRYGFVVGGSSTLSKKFLTRNQAIDFALSISDTNSGGGKLAELAKRQIGSAEKLVEAFRDLRSPVTRYEANIDVGT